MTGEFLCTMKVYGSTLRSGCGKQKPQVFGRVTMETRTNNCVLNEQFASMNEAAMFLQRIANDCANNGFDRIDTRTMFKETTGRFVYSRTTIMNNKQRTNCVITIF